MTTFLLLTVVVGAFGAGFTAEVTRDGKRRPLARLHGALRELRHGFSEGYSGRDRESAVEQRDE
jgi:hypothetical protein